MSEHFAPSEASDCAVSLVTQDKLSGVLSSFVSGKGPNTAASGLHQTGNRRHSNASDAQPQTPDTPEDEVKIAQQAASRREELQAGIRLVQKTYTAWCETVRICHLSLTGLRY
jgi:hypothetical protein